MNLLPHADQYTLNDIKGAADIVEEINELVTICGFCQPQTTGTDTEKKAMKIWSLLKITQSGTTYPITTTIQWAGGICSYNQVWNDRAGADYKFKNI
jgi:hypothetical protein